jgi:hypothetical protein
MGRSWFFWALMCSVLLVAATSRSDVAQTTTTPSLTAEPVSADAVAEPITGEASAPATGDEQSPKDPFGPYGVGDSPTWSYAQLSAADKAVADKGRDVTGWAATNQAFAAASTLRAKDAASTAAASQLGVEDLATTGVVP